MSVTRAWAAGAAFEPGGGSNASASTSPDAVAHMLGDDFEAAAWPQAALQVMAAVAGRCNSADVRLEDGEWRTIGQPTDVALRVFAHNLGYTERLTLLHEFPFDSTLKRMVVVARDEHGQVSVLVKGSLDALLPMCTRMLGSSEERWETDRAAVEVQMRAMARLGLRVLVLAARGAVCADSGDGALADDGGPWMRADLEHDLVLVGLAGLQDPPRAGVAEAIEDCTRVGIRVRMLTDDDVQTAASIAAQVGIVARPGADGIDDAPVPAMHARDFDALSPEQLDAQDDLPRVVARCTPESKVTMVEALHRRLCIVAMTGDGVNDAPALSAANVGIAMGKSELRRGAAVGAHCVE